MGLLEDVRNMQQGGKSEPEISFALQARGFPAKEIQEAMAQAKIKDAVAGVTAVSSDEQKMAKTDFQNQDMKPSMMSATEPAPPQEYSAVNQEYENQAPSENQNPEPSASQEQYPAQDSQNYDSYSQYQQYPSYSPNGVSSDVINEIAEQIITEKLSSLRNKIEETLDFKNITESKILYLDERLKRMEKIIDRLQLSVLQKVGDFMTNVEDIKKELIETQKSFKSIQQSRPHSTHTSQSSQISPTEQF